MEFLILPFDSALQYESNRYHIWFYLSPHPRFSWHVLLLGGNREFESPAQNNIVLQSKIHKILLLDKIKEKNLNHPLIRLNGHVY